MLKPIVSMNQMAMNESIATTCCYVWNGTSLLGSASLPHGGSLVAKSKTSNYVKINNAYYGLNGTWYGYTDGHAAKPEVAADVVTTSTEGVVGYHDNTNTTLFKSMTQAIADGDVTPALNGFCDHKNNPTCPYFKETKFAGAFTHTGATSGHYTWTGGNSWLADHTAVQYSS